MFTLEAQLAEMNFHVVFQEPGLLEASPTHLALVVKRVFVLSHVALEEPRLGEGLATNLASELSRRGGSRGSGGGGRRGGRDRRGRDWDWRGRRPSRKAMSLLVVPLQVRLLRGRKGALPTLVRLVEDAEVALPLSRCAEFPLAERAAEGGLGWGWDRNSRLLFFLLLLLLLTPQKCPLLQLKQQPALVAEAGTGLGAVRSQVEAQAGPLPCPMTAIGAGERVGAGVDAGVEGQDAVESESLATDGARVRAGLTP